MGEHASTWERIALISAMTEKAPKGALNRTALMKCAYFLQTLKRVPLGYRFTLYAYGPYDSDVLDDLEYAEMLDAVTVTTVQYPGGYGYKIRPGTKAEAVKGRASEFLEEHFEDIDWVLGEFGDLMSADLELQSTIVYADRDVRPRTQTLDQLVRRVRDVKPHFSEGTIRRAATALHQNGLLNSINAS